MSVHPVHRRARPSGEEVNVNWALFVAASDNRREDALRLWPAGSPEGRGHALKGAITHGHRDLLANLITLMDQSPVDRKEATSAFNQAIRQHEEVSVLRPLLRWIDPHLDQASPLRMAVEEGHWPAVELLLQVTDPNVARHEWSVEQPPRWDLAQQLVSHLPQAIREDWFKTFPVELASAQEQQSAEAVERTPHRRSRRPF